MDRQEASGCLGCMQVSGHLDHWELSPDLRSCLGWCGNIRVIRAFTFGRRGLKPAKSHPQYQVHASSHQRPPSLATTSASWRMDQPVARKLGNRAMVPVMVRMSKSSMSIGGENASPWRPRTRWLCSAVNNWPRRATNRAVRQFLPSWWWPWPVATLIRLRWCVGDIAAEDAPPSHRLQAVAGRIVQVAALLQAFQSPLRIEIPHNASTSKRSPRHVAAIPEKEVSPISKASCSYCSMAADNQASHAPHAPERDRVQPSAIDGKHARGRSRRTLRSCGHEWFGGLASYHSSRSAAMEQAQHPPEAVVRIGQIRLYHASTFR